MKEAYRLTVEMPMDVKDRIEKVRGILHRSQYALLAILVKLARDEKSYD